MRATGWFVHLINHIAGKHTWANCAERRLLVSAVCGVSGVFSACLPLPEDVNITAIVVGVGVVVVLVAACSCGGFLLHRNGFFSRESNPLPVCLFVCCWFRFVWRVTCVLLSYMDLVTRPSTSRTQRKVRAPRGAGPGVGAGASSCGAVAALGLRPRAESGLWGATAARPATGCNRCKAPKGLMMMICVCFDWRQTIQSENNQLDVIMNNNEQKGKWWQLNSSWMWTVKQILGGAGMEEWDAAHPTHTLRLAPLRGSTRAGSRRASGAPPSWRRSSLSRLKSDAHLATLTGAVGVNFLFIARASSQRLVDNVTPFLIVCNCSCLLHTRLQRDQRNKRKWKLPCEELFVVGLWKDAAEEAWDELHVLVHLGILLRCSMIGCMFTKSRRCDWLKGTLAGNTWMHC